LTSNAIISSAWYEVGKGILISYYNYLPVHISLVDK